MNLPWWRINNETGQVLAVGKEAKEFLGRTPARISAIRPMKDGVIADFDVTREMIKYFLIKVRERSRFFRPNLVIGVPSGITMVEKTGRGGIRPGGRRPGYLPDRRTHGSGHRRRTGQFINLRPTW